MTPAQVRLNPPAVTHPAYLHASVNLLQEDALHLLHLKAGSFWSVVLCERWLGRGWKCDGLPEMGKGFLAASSASREQSGVKPGSRKPAF